MLDAELFGGDGDGKMFKKQLSMVLSQVKKREEQLEEADMLEHKKQHEKDDEDNNNNAISERDSDSDSDSSNSESPASPASLTSEANAKKLDKKQSMASRPLLNASSSINSNL